MREFWERIDTGGRNKNNAKLFKLGEEFYPGAHDQHSSPDQTGWLSTRNSLHSDIPFQVGDEEDEEDVPVVSKLNGPQKASDLYLDTVRLPQGHYLLCFFSQYAYRSTELS